MYMSMHTYMGTYTYNADTAFRIKRIEKLAAVIFHYRRISTYAIIFETMLRYNFQTHEYLIKFFISKAQLVH